MPDPETIERARRDKEEGKSPSTQAGEFVREEIEHVRKGIHGARSTKQAIAIGLSKARRAGVKLKPPRAGTTSTATRRQAARDSRRHGARRPPAPGRPAGQPQRRRTNAPSAAAGRVDQETQSHGNPSNPA